MKQEHAAPNASTAATAVNAGGASETAADGGVVAIKKEPPVADAPAAAAAGTSASTTTTTTSMDVDTGVIAGKDAPSLTVKTEQQQLEGAVPAAAAAAQEKPNGVGESPKPGNGDGAVGGKNGDPIAAGGSAGDDKPKTPAKQEQPEPSLGRDTTAAAAVGAAAGATAGGGISRSTSASGRPGRLPLDPTTVHPAFAGRRPLFKHESPASGRAYGLWDPSAVHPVYFGHLRHDGEAAGAAGLTGWTGAGDGGAIDRALRILRGAADSEASAATAAVAAAATATGCGEGGGGKSREVAGVAGWSAEERATVLGLLCEEASVTGVALDHMNVGGVIRRRAGGLRPLQACVGFLIGVSVELLGSWLCLASIIVCFAACTQSDGFAQLSSCGLGGGVLS